MQEAPLFERVHWRAGLILRDRIVELAVDKIRVSPSFSDDKVPFTQHLGRIFKSSIPPIFFRFSRIITRSLPMCSSLLVLTSVAVRICYGAVY